MKLEIEVYALNEPLYHMRDNEIRPFWPKKLIITCEYEGYSGDHWGDISSKHGGYPIRIQYEDKAGDAIIREHHYKLFRTKEDLIKSLMEKK